MKQNKKQARLDKLEQDTNTKGGHAVLYADPDNPGEYTERSPWSKDPGKRFSEAEKCALADQFDLVIIEYTREWRNGEPSPAFI